MWSAVAIMAVIWLVGTQATDRVRVRQQEVVLHKLPLPDAHAYYHHLRRRLWRIRVLRMVTLASLVLVLFAGRHRLSKPAPRAVLPATGAQR